MNLEQVLARMAQLRVLVVGDLCLDRWCRYDPALAEPSRETGIPRVAVVSSLVTPGAAGTVACNVAALGASVDVLSVVGDDGFGMELRRALEARGIGNRVIIAADFSTFTYTKLLNCRNEVEDRGRIDFVNTRPLPGRIEAQFITELEHIVAGYQVLLVSDQAETPEGGVVSSRVRNVLTRISNARQDLIIWVDSRLRAEHFRKVIVKMNQPEAEEASRRLLEHIDFKEFRRRTEAPLLVITHGPRGALLIDERDATWATTQEVNNPVDICGAGDSFSAGAALSLRVTQDPVYAARVGNLAAAVTIMKKGTGTASPQEVLLAAASHPGSTAPADSAANQAE